jgi:hypothetical protein
VNYQEYLAHCRQNLAIGVEQFDTFRRILEVLEVVVSIEGGEPRCR